MKITLVRHGQTEANYNHIIQGRVVNKELNETGQKACYQLRERLKDVDFSICYMSPMLRTVETAFILVGDRVETVPDTRLLERDMGELSGQSREKYDAVTYWDYDLNCSSLGVEPVQDVFKRCQEFLDYVIKKHSGEHILIVSHGAVIRACHHLLHHHNLHKNLLNVNISNLYCETIEILDKKK